MLDNVREFSMKELDSYDLEIALENGGYLDVGIQKSEFSHSYVGSHGPSYAYVCKFIDDGSFEEDDNRIGHIFVHINHDSGKIVGEW